jgi:hypothetical protein
VTAFREQKAKTSASCYRARPHDIAKHVGDIADNT